MHLPGATESATVRNDFVCSLCSSPLQEDMKFRVLGGKFYVVLFLDLLLSYFCCTVSKQNSYVEKAPKYTSPLKKKKKKKALQFSRELTFSLPLF